MSDFKECLNKIIGCGSTRIIVSNPVNKTEAYKKIIIEKKADNFHVSKYTEKQVFHENIKADDLADSLYSLIFGHYKQINAWSKDKEHSVLISKKGVCNYKETKSINETDFCGEHNRKKNYILAEGTAIQPLIDMGIFASNGKIINSMYSKYRQINRFLEIIDDEITKSNINHLNVIDFGCGKSYLTFILYYYLTEIKKITVNMVGLDLKADVIQKCNAASQKYGYHNLRFELGDINGYLAPFDVDMVITLHACDTATDYALFNAINWNAKYIFSVPCCQHELNEQIKPNKLSALTRYGIIKERFSALATDTIRGYLLEYSGYKTQLLEFIDFDHTPKNILIRAVKRPNTSQQKRQALLNEVKQLTDEFDFKPTLCKLLNVFPKEMKDC